jgi:hypothetical protein
MRLSGRLFKQKTPQEQQRPSSLGATEDALIGQVGAIMEVAKNHLETSLGDLKGQRIVIWDAGLTDAAQQVITFHQQDGEESNLTRATTKDSLLAAEIFLLSTKYLEASYPDEKKQALQQLATEVEKCQLLYKENPQVFNAESKYQDSFAKLMERVDKFQKITSKQTNELRKVFRESGQYGAGELCVLAVVDGNEERVNLLEQAQGQFEKEEFNNLMEQITQLRRSGGTEEGKKGLEAFFRQLKERLNEETKSNRSSSDSFRTIPLFEGDGEQHEQKPEKGFFERLATACQPREGAKPLVSRQENKNQSVL